MPTCAQDVNALDQRIRANYAGFKLEVTGEKAQRYRQALAGFVARAANATADSCFVILSDLTRWFDDPHLFLYQFAELDTTETAARARTVATMDMTEVKARAWFTSHARTLDPIEGIWYDGALRVAVVPDPGQSAGHFVAVVLTADTSIWHPGAVRARIERRARGRYDVTLSERDYAIHHRDGVIYRNVILRLSPGMWGKSFPITPADSAMLDHRNVHRPTILARDGTVIVSVPSDDPQYKPVLDSLIATHSADLLRAQRLIVDLRGNEGGGSFMTDGLMPYIATAHEPPGILNERESVILSSDDQIEYASRAFGPDSDPSVRRLLARMRAHVGELVALADSEDPPAAPPVDSVIHGPQRVGILIDGGTVSASEVLVLEAMRSARVTVFGEPTAGALDYESVNIVPFSPGERRWYLGYPTITRSTALPAGGMRGKGIAPTVRIDLAHTADPIAVVDRALGRRGPPA